MHLEIGAGGSHDCIMAERDDNRCQAGVTLHGMLTFPCHSRALRLRSGQAPRRIPDPSSPLPVRERIKGEGRCSARDFSRARLKVLLTGWPVIGNGRAAAVLEQDRGKKTHHLRN